MALHQLVRTIDSMVLIPRVEVAQSLGQRLIGLMGRPALAADAALFLPRCRAIHTCFMRFSMDAVFVDDTMIVVGILRRIRPCRFPRPWLNAWGVFELAGGRAEELRIRVGEQLRLESLNGSSTA